MSRYDGMIEYEPTFPAPYKRKVAIFKAQSKMVDAVNELNRYLSTFRYIFVANSFNLLEYDYYIIYRVSKEVL